MTSPSPATTIFTWLEVLPSELVVKVATDLDLSSSLALASTSNSLSTILTNPAEWTKICAKISRMFWGALQEVEEITSFLRLLEEPEELFAILFHCICSQYPSSTASITTITIACSLHHHRVSPQGMHLLHLATSAMAAEPRTITDVVVNNSSSHLEDLDHHFPSLVSWVEKQEQKVSSLQVKHLHTGQGHVLLDSCMSLLKKCSSWEVMYFTVLVTSLVDGTLDVEEEEVTKFWSRLAVAMDKGKVNRIMTNRESMVQGEVQDLRKVWEATAEIWGIFPDRILSGGLRIILREEGLEEGWQKLEEVLAGIEEEEEIDDSFEEIEDEVEGEEGGEESGEEEEN